MRISVHLPLFGTGVLALQLAASSSLVLGLLVGSAGFGRLISVDIQWRPSPNFEARPAGTVIDTVVLHANVLDSLEATCEHFSRPSSQVSCHYTIGRDGTIVQHVLESDRAFHAGESRMADGRGGVNAFSIGIELVNLNDGVDPYPAAQFDALRRLLSEISSRHQIRNVVSHAEIAMPPGRKSDPAGLDVSQFRAPLQGE